MLAQVVTWVVAISMALVIVGAFVYILGFAVSMIGAVFYVPIKAIADADIHMPRMHWPHIHMPHAA